MKTRRRPRPVKQPCRWGWLLLTLLLIPFSTASAADYMKDDAYYTMSSSNNDDHVQFQILLTDLYSTNTYSVGGKIRAYSGLRTGVCFEIMELYTKDMNNDYAPEWDVYARLITSGAKAWFANGSNSSTPEVAYSNSCKTYSLHKGSNNDYLTAKIDYYFPPQMADGKRWFFYYEYEHNKGDHYNMYLGSAVLSPTVKCKEFNTADFSYTRSGADKIKVTLPAMPNDVADKLKDNRWHVGVYNISFIYVLQDNYLRTVTERLECQVGSEKTYEITIPEDVGNFKSLDMQLEVQEALKCENDAYFWNNNDSYYRHNVFPMVPVPNALVAEYNQNDNKAELMWNGYYGSNYIEESIPYVYRLETDGSGNALSGKSWEKRATLDAMGKTMQLSYTDKNLSPNTYYKYMVVNVPKEWTNNNNISSSDLNSPSEKLLKRLGYTVSDIVETKPTMSIFNLAQDVSETEKVKITWQYTRVPVKSNSVTFNVMRRTNEEAEWNNYGSVTADADPGSGKTLTFIDTDLPNNRVRYDYKITLSINDGQNTFESDVIKAGLLTGSTITKVEATKGTHENVVRVTWKARQVGNENTNYDILRRYAGTQGEFLKVYSTSGQSDSYTYEDNTVLQGYYYEYKVEAYSGEKESFDDNTYQNSMSDVGFCQARGVISGRVTFGTGTAVEDVRISLRASGENDDNGVKGYSQYVSGATTGMAWKVDEERVANVFGEDKSYTIQMFVRPESGLSDALVATVPWKGMVFLSEQQDSVYKVLHGNETSDKTWVENYSNNLVHLRAVYYYANPEYSKILFLDGQGHTIPVYSNQEYEDICNQWTDEGYSMVMTYSAGWVEVPNSDVCRMAVFKKTEEIILSSGYESSFDLYDTGLTLPASTFSLLSVQNENGNMSFGVNNTTSSEETFYKTLMINGVVETLDVSQYTVYKGNYLDDTGSLIPNLLESEWTYSNYVSEYTEGIQSRKIALGGTDTSIKTFFLGGAEGFDFEKSFKGNFTEVRVWDHVLSEKEQQTYADRILNGREKGLQLYWPMDEGIDRHVFDASYTEDVPNGRHATVGANIRKSNIIPSDERLSRYGMTNENGEFSVRGIPFVGSGSTYTITPLKGIHKFSPSSRNGFIGNGSIALNGYDFTDMSSFPMRGTITYLNTNIPVDSVQFKIDGQLVQGDNQMIMSDANGEYEISVPLGKHRVEAFRNGHHLTSFPMEPNKTWDFVEDVVANFVDSTLVNVTGRINGGFSDQDEPLGFALTKNRLGKAIIKLSLGKENSCSFNYIVDDEGSGEFGTVDIPVESASANIRSTARRAGGTPDETNYVYITTDEETGEFSAMLPPLKYMVESIHFVGGTDYDNLPLFSENLPVIDATNAVDDLMQKDSVMVGNEMKSYKYSAKQIWQYRATPEIKVYQEGMANGVFGEIKVALANPDQTNDSIEVVTFSGDTYHYVYGHPIFVQSHEYEFGIDVAESYTNLDTKEIFKEIPRDAQVSIINDASVLTTVFGEKAIIDGREMEAGTAYDVQNIKIVPDKDGHVSYNWTGGWPNLGTEYLRNLSIGVAVDGRTTMWKAPDSSTNALDLVMLGSITSGTNFVTDGPNHVDMILRRPPGSTSQASLTQECVTSYITSSVKVENGESWGGGAFVSLTPTFEIHEGALLPAIILKDSKLKVLLTTENTAESKWWDTSQMDTVNTYTVSQEMTTSQDYIQNGGDTYIGRSTNMLFGKGRLLGIYKAADGTFKLDVNEALTIGEVFNTTFVLPQNYILNTLIPNWQAIIDSKLREGYVTGNHWDDNVAVRVPGEVRYYTKYQPGDPEYGRSNADKFWSTETFLATNRCPSYRLVNGTGEPIDDVVEHAIQQITQWRNIIALNEQEKLEAFESRSAQNNFSIAGGTSVSETTSSQYSTSLVLKEDYSYCFSSETKVGVFINDAGFNGILTRTLFHGETTGHGGSTSTTNTISWTLSDADPRTALSVDMYPSTNGWGPMFRTRGGQSANPYEGATYSLFYNPGTLMDEATMRVEYPQLRVQGAREITDVPTGGSAKFMLEMTNLSETNSSCTYILEAIESSNAKGAILMIDGQPLSLGHAGRAIPMNGNETLLKTLFVSQSDRSITDFDDIKLVLRSEKDGSTCSDTISLTVHFVPASAIAEIKVDHTVLTQNDENNGFLVTVFNLDRQDEGLRGVRVQYRRKGTDAWTLAKQWVQKEYMGDGDDELPEGSSFSCIVSMLSDGDYELRAQTYGKYGNDDVTYETDIIDVTQDMRGPQILGMPYPTTGTLFYDTRNNMHITFNEPINVNALSKTDNFRIDGYLNNASFSGQYRDVALQLNGDGIQTQATYTLSDTDLAMDMWFYRQGDGNIISMGTEDNQFALFTHDGGQIGARVGTSENIYDTGVTLPADQWTYIALSYKKKTADDPENRISMLYVNADMDQPVSLNDMPARDIEGAGRLTVGGDGMKGRMHDLTLWNTDKSISELYETREEIKAAYTLGLVGYWRMDEGHGITLYDKARSRNMVMNAESWYINNRNLAAHLDGTQPFKVDIAPFAPRTTDNYALEMWFRGDNVESNQNAMLMSVLDRMKIGFQEGKLVFIKSKREVDSQNVEKETVTELVTLSEENYNDNEWHHLAFNVRRGTSAVAYIDGKAVKTLPEGNVPAISSHYLFVGGEETLLGSQSAGGSTNLFTGDIDEVRIWNAALTGKLIDERRYERLDSTYSGLIGYFPMESIHRISSGTVVTEFNTGNFGCRKVMTLSSEGEFAESVNSPALLPGSQRMRFDNTEFDFTASESDIYFSFPSHMLPKMDGNSFIMTVENVKDKHGNSSEPIEWTFSTNFATLSWMSQELNITKKWDQSTTFVNVLRNSSSTYTPQGFELEGLPSWLTVTDVEQVAENGSFQYRFTIEPNVPVGRYTEYIYVTEELGSSRMFKLNLTVKGDEPDWVVNPDLYESNMALTGQIYVRDKISEYTDSKIAAFDEAGNCRGVASPKYVASRDAYYIDMIVYGGASTDVSTSQRNIFFKMYDASTGKTYPVVNVTLPDGITDNSILYAPDAIYGSYDKPVVFSATDMLQQLTSLPRGWTWMSVYVDPVSKDIRDFLPKNKVELKNFLNIKGHNAYATVASDGSDVLGQLQEIGPGNMYKIQVSTATTLNTVGYAINVRDTIQTIYPGYNWIGSLSNAVMSPAEAFAELEPMKGDMVKNRTSYATYNGQGLWEGTLKSIIPGQGYIYLSKATEVKTFHYPVNYASLDQYANIALMDLETTTHYVPADEHLFPDNMNITAVVEKDGQRIEDAEVGAFINGECRGAVLCNNGYYFLTVMGSSTEDLMSTIEIRVFMDGEEFVIENEKPFISDAVIGTLEEPYVLDITASAIRTIADDEYDDAEWYTLQGFKIGRRPTQAGVYIHRGEKVAIRSKQQR